MRVYLLERDPAYHDDCADVLGVFSTVPAAQAAAAEQHKQQPGELLWNARGDTGYTISPSRVHTYLYSIRPFIVDVAGEADDVAQEATT